jgi:amidase
MQDLVSLTALEQAELIRKRAISSEELTWVYLDRIARVDPLLHAFVNVFERRALADARAKDKALRRLSVVPPFHGVPIGIKDLNFVRFSATRLGTRALPPLYSPVDDHTVRALRRGGFVILGKLATSELGAMPVTEPDGQAPTRNPWDLARSSGGSSGGSGAAVAAGLVPIAQGSDGAGSIRIPSAFCHLYGFKPSRGRVRNAFGLKDRRILYTCGPIARSVADAAAMLDVLAGLSCGTPHWAPAPPAPFAHLLRAPPKPLRVRLILRTPLAETDPEIAEAVRGAARVLEQLGHVIEETEPPSGSLAEFLPLWQRLVASTPGANLRGAQPVTRWLARAGSKLRARDVEALFDRLGARFAAEAGSEEVWISPTVPLPAPPVGAYANLEPSEAFERASVYGGFTAVCNVTGQPAASFPLGLTRAGLPIGLQIIGKPLGDADVFAVSRQLELALPFRERKPPIWHLAGDRVGRPSAPIDQTSL